MKIGKIKYIEPVDMNAISAGSDCYPFLVIIYKKELTVEMSDL